METGSNYPCRQHKNLDYSAKEKLLRIPQVWHQSLPRAYKSNEAWAMTFSSVRASGWLRQRPATLLPGQYRAMRVVVAQALAKIVAAAK